MNFAFQVLKSQENRVKLTIHSLTWRNFLGKKNKFGYR